MRINRFDLKRNPVAFFVITDFAEDADLDAVFERRHIGGVLAYCPVIPRIYQGIDLIGVFDRRSLPAVILFFDQNKIDEPVAYFKIRHFAAKPNRLRKVRFDRASDAFGDFGDGVCFGFGRRPPSRTRRSRAIRRLGAGRRTVCVMSGRAIFFIAEFDQQMANRFNPANAADSPILSPAARYGESAALDQKACSAFVSGVVDEPSLLCVYPAEFQTPHIWLPDIGHKRRPDRLLLQTIRRASPSGKKLLGNYPPISDVMTSAIV